LQPGRTILPACKSIRRRQIDSARLQIDSARLQNHSAGLQNHSAAGGTVLPGCKSIPPGCKPVPPGCKSVLRPHKTVPRRLYLKRVGFLSTYEADGEVLRQPALRNNSLFTKIYLTAQN
jgi:hypothetical protein